MVGLWARPKGASDDQLALLSLVGFQEGLDVWDDARPLQVKDRSCRHHFIDGRQQRVQVSDKPKIDRPLPPE